jgi:hypothetical protein
MLDHSSNLQSRKDEVEAEELLPSGVYSFFVALFGYQQSCYASLDGVEVFEGLISDDRLPLIDFGRSRFRKRYSPRRERPEIGCFGDYCAQSGA